MSRSHFSRVSLGFGALALFACSAQPISEGADEPFVVQGAQFIEGELPGARPLTPEEAQDGVTSEAPYPTAAEPSKRLIVQGLAGVTITGRTTDDSVSIGARIEGLGSGYWVVPTKDHDPQYAGELTYNLSAAFAHSVAPGVHRLLVTAFDENGHSGTQASAEICVERVVPDNHNACRPSLAPPVVVASLAWDAPVDLDLRVFTPEQGRVIDSQNPNNADADESGNVDVSQAGVGVLDFDSNRACQIDARQRENVVWQTQPKPGRYHLYAKLKSACGQAAAHYTMSIHTLALGSEPDTYTVVETTSVSGTVIAVEAEDTASPGTFVTEFLVQ